MMVKSNQKFFSIWRQNFWKLVLANMSLLLLNFPFLCGGFWLVNFILQNLFPRNSFAVMAQLLINRGVETKLAYDTASYQQMFWQALFMLIFIGLGLILFVPFETVFARLYKAWINGDLFFWKEDALILFKKNFMWGTVHTVLNFAALILCTIALHFYQSMTQSLSLKIIFLSIVSLVIFFLLMLQPVMQMLYLHNAAISWIEVIKLGLILVSTQLLVNLRSLLERLVIIVVIPLFLFFFLSPYALIATFVLGAFFVLAPAQLLGILRAEQIAQQYDLDKLLESLRGN